MNRRFTAAEWAAGHLFVEGDPDITTPLSTEESALRTAAGSMFTASLPECACWPYTSPYAPHDKYGVSGSESATDGHTFYGNVFGGGSGYFPYEADKWNMKAGRVEGNTLLEIKGGHILTSAYGGGELANVGDGTLTGTQGKATVRMTGGTLGVPRTLAQIDAHPVTCYLFGSGKGDQHTHFNKDTNVKEVEMEVTGGRIYGSVFGGGEDGHVLGDVKMTIGNSDGTGPIIGTFGTSYVDGNVFGGGRGFSGEALTAGNVGGSVNLNILGGTIKGSVYGGGRLASVGYGLYLVDEVVGGVKPYGVMRDDDKMDDGTATDYFTTTGMNKNGRGNIVVNISGGTIGNDLEYVYVNADNAASVVGQGDIAKTEFRDAAAFTEKVKDEDGLITEASTSTTYRKLSHTKGGNVFGGSMGRIYKLDGTNPIDIWDKLAHAKTTTVNISGNALIKSSVFGGSELGQVEGNTVINISGTPTIGSEITKKITDDEDVTQYGFGAVYAGGFGSETSLSSTYPNYANPREVAGQVGGNTTVNMSGGKVKASVYGGGKIATVLHNTYVNISGGEVGINKVRKDDGYVMYGGDAVGNVYGGGKGSLTDARMGVVKGNTNVNITGGNIYHMVYGGGALGSVGTFEVSKKVEGVMVPAYMPVEGIPYTWTNGTGTATVNITGGTIGISGRDNGLVFGSSRGGVSKPVGTPPIDPYLKVAWVDKAVVNIGTAKANPTDPDDLTAPLIKGSVYGGGENGHNYTNATVNVYSGTIGITDKIPGTNTADPWWDFGSDDLNTKYRANRGNVYGAGSGADTYTADDGTERYNPKTGMVGGNTFVNIYGGHIGRSVYGAGAMASVGNITNGRDTTDVARGGTGTAKHMDIATVDGKEVIHGLGLSWPYKFVFAPNTGKATVNVTGGHIGTKDVDGGDVFGGARGEAGDRYATAHLALVNNAEVNINYPALSESESYDDLIPNISEDFTIPCVTGSVSGSGEDGYVYGDTHVTLNEGLVGHSLYGGGKGKGTYKVTLNKIVGSGTYEAEIYSLIAGKVFGNTYVTMNGGYVGRNVYGGGNMASVGKGNYAGGVDDYFPNGYGETLVSGSTYGTGNLWDGVSDESKAFLNSGITSVKVFGGTVGYVAADPKNSIKNNLPYGNVFGGSAGEAAPNVPQSLSPRYKYCPAFFSGYVNETDVNIGGYECITAFSHDDKNYAVGDTMTLGELQKALAGSEYLVNSKPNTTYWKVIGPTKIYGSVYGGGQDGHVRRDTHVTVVAGEIGLAFTPENRALLKTNTLSSITDELDNDQWLARGNVYGAGSGISQYEFDFNNDGDKVDKGVTIGTGSYDEKGYSTSAGSVTRFTQVDILGGTIHRNVYGGGSMGSIGPLKTTQLYDPYKKNLDDTSTLGKQTQCTVNISGTVGTLSDYKQVYGGEVYGASRGMSDMDDATAIGDTLRRVPDCFVCRTEGTESMFLRARKRIKKVALTEVECH